MRKIAYWLIAISMTLCLCILVIAVFDGLIRFLAAAALIIQAVALGMFHFLLKEDDEGRVPSDRG